MFFELIRDSGHRGMFYCARQARLSQPEAKSLLTAHQAPLGCRPDSRAGPGAPLMPETASVCNQTSEMVKIAVSRDREERQGMFGCGGWATHARSRSLD